MRSDQIRRHLEMGITTRNEWLEVLNNTNPGHYGVVEYDMALSQEQISVDTQKGQFLIKDVEYNFMLRLKNSSDEIEFAKWFSRTVSGEGRFCWDRKFGKTTIETLILTLDLNLFSREEHWI